MLLGALRPRAEGPESGPIVDPESRLVFTSRRIHVGAIDGVGIQDRALGHEIPQLLHLHFPSIGNVDPCKLSPLKRILTEVMVSAYAI